MTRPPRRIGSDVIKALENAGFDVVRVKGSHHRRRHPDGRSTTVPVHGQEVIGPGLLSKILKDCEIGTEEFIRLLDDVWATAIVGSRRVWNESFE